MSEAATLDGEAHGHEDGHHDEFLGHHFKDQTHQFNTGKLGIWLFLGQELLFFGGLFCAYSIYRGLHPEIFVEGHFFLDTKLGAINTCILLFSSLTAAWSVRAAQLGQQKILLACIGITIACAFGFLIIKYFEYTHKFHEGIFWAGQTGRLDCADPNLANTIGCTYGFDPSVETLRETIGSAEANRRLKVFFSIYFVMTGLHGIHVIAGIIAYFYLGFRAWKGHFRPGYYGPVDFVALYWHLVDLVWIFLFPLLYLIH